MERGELIEWVLIIAVIMAWWPRIFLGFDPPWYHALIFYVSPLVLAVILVRRYRRMQAGFEYSRKIVDAQHQARGVNVLGQETGGAGPQSPYPGVILPDKAEAELSDIPGIPGGESDEESPPEE